MTSRIEKLPLAFFAATLILFVYLLLARPIGFTTEPELSRSLLLTLFSGSYTIDANSTIFLRSTLVFLAGFSVIWFLLNLRREPDAEA